MAPESNATLSRNPFGYHRRRWWVGLTAFLFLFLIGPLAMFGDMDRGTIHHASQLAEHYQTMLLCFSLLLLYLVPFCVFVRYTRMRAGVPRWLVVLAFASGLFIPGWIAGELNDAADVLLRAATSKAFVSTWAMPSRRRWWKRRSSSSPCWRCWALPDATAAATGSWAACAWAWASSSTRTWAT